jgi:hypothetical protein
MHDPQSGDNKALLAALDDECDIALEAVRTRLKAGRIGKGPWVVEEDLCDRLRELFRALVRMGVRGTPSVESQAQFWGVAGIEARYGEALLVQADDVICGVADRLVLGLIRKGLLPPPRAIYTGVSYVPGGRQAEVPGKFPLKRSPTRKGGNATLRVGAVIGGAVGLPTAEAEDAFAHRMRSEVVVRPRDVKKLRPDALFKWVTRPLDPADIGYSAQGMYLAVDLRDRLGIDTEPREFERLPVVLGKAAVPDAGSGLGLVDEDRELPGNDLDIVLRASRLLGADALVLAACGETGHARRFSSTWFMAFGEGGQTAIPVERVMEMIALQAGRPSHRRLASGDGWSIDQISKRIVDGRERDASGFDPTLLLFHAIIPPTELGPGGALMSPYVANRRIASEDEEDVARVVDALVPLHRSGEVSARFEQSRNDSVTLPLAQLACGARNARTNAHFERMRDIINACRLARAFNDS